MKLHKQGWIAMASVALVAAMASTALAIEAFQERFEWGDMSKPTTIQGRVIVLDPYDEAVWINVSVYRYRNRAEPPRDFFGQEASRGVRCHGQALEYFSASPQGLHGEKRDGVWLCSS